MANCCSTKDPGGLDTRYVMIVLLGNLFVQCVLLTTGRYLEIQSFLYLHIKASLAIGVEMFITLDMPSDAGKGNIVLIRCNTIVEVVPRVLDPKNIPSKPQDKAMDSITVVHSIHC